MITLPSYSSTCEDYNNYKTPLEKKAFLFGVVQKLEKEVQFKAVRLYFKALEELCISDSEKIQISQRLDKLPSHFAMANNDSDTDKVKPLFHHSCWEVGESGLSGSLSRAFQEGALYNKTSDLSKEFNDLYIDSCVDIFQEVGSLTLTLISTLEEKSGSTQEVTNTSRTSAPKDKDSNTQSSKPSSAQSIE